MILESVESGPLIWPSIEENGVTRPKKYSELSATEALQADCDIKATNIILQGLPPEVYALVSNHKVAKELWERIQLLMQGTSLSKQERKCKLYDEFDKFAYNKGETLRDFYLRFSLLLNDMNIYNMKLEQFQVNTKFLNTLPLEWSKFGTDVKLVRDLHTTNVDQLHAYLGQHEYHANEVRLMHERNSDPLALSPQYGSPYQSQQYSTHQSSTPLSITYPSNDYQSSIHHNVYSPSSSIPQLEYAPSVNQQSKFSQSDTGLIIPVFQKGDDPINAINHMMSFFTAVVTSRYPTTNNQLRNSSNPRQQATINNGRVTLQPIQGRQTSFTAGTTSTYTPGVSGSNSGKQRTVICYSCKGEDHMSKQCTKPKRKWDDSWFKEKVLLVEAQAHVALMANLSHYGSDALAESNVMNQSKTEITSDINIIPYSQYVIESQQATIQNSNSSAQQDDLILSVIEQLKTQVANCTKINLENKSVKDTLTTELERYKEQVKVLKEDQKVDLKSQDNVLHTCAQSVEIDLLKQTLSEHLKERTFKREGIFIANDKGEGERQSSSQLEHMLYVGDIIQKTNPIVIPDSEETLTLAKESRSKMLLKHKDNMMLEKIKQVDTTPIDYAALNQLYKDFETRFVPQTKLSTEQAVEQHRVESKTFEVKMNQVLNENERLLEQVMSKDIVNILVNSSMDNECVNVHECKKCLELDTELQTNFIEKEIYDNLFKNFTTLEKHCISLEVENQLNQEIFQRDNSVPNQNDPSFDQLFELNELKAQS
ncbi:hypothetical protein Tco_0578223 [Tanacetum coccineum]